MEQKFKRDCKHTKKRMDDMLERLIKIRDELTMLIAAIQTVDGSDQIRSDRSIIKDPSRSDQIRPDHPGYNQVDTFQDVCAKYGVDVASKDIRGIERNISWFLAHNSGIRSPKAYIEKMLAACPDKIRVGFHPEKETVQDNTIMGLAPDLVLEKVPYLDEFSYKQVRDKVPGWKTIIPTFEAVMRSEMKKNVVTAYCILEGVL